MAEPTILQNPFFVELILPFVLVFTIVFAILQKTKLLGDGKRQIDAIVALVIGLIVVSFGFATGIILSLVPVLAVSVVVLFVFMLIYGMTHSGDKEFKLPGKVPGIIGALGAIIVVVTLLFSTGAWSYIENNFLYAGASNPIVINAIYILIVVGVIVAVSWGGKKSKES